MSFETIKHYKKSKERNIVFSIFSNGLVSDKDEQMAEPAECKNVYNLVYSGGALKTGLGFEELKIPASASDNVMHKIRIVASITSLHGMWMNRFWSSVNSRFAYQLVFLDQTYQVWVVPIFDAYDGQMWARQGNMSNISAPPSNTLNICTESEDSFIFFTPEGMSWLGTSSEGFFQNVPQFISTAVHYGKFFGIENTTHQPLVYTSNLNLKEWNSQNRVNIEFVDDRGASIKVVAFNDYVYIFRERGITRISIYSSKDDFSYTHLYTSSSRIFEKSICVCGDKVLFMTREGLFSFNGNSVKKICENYDKYFMALDNKNCDCACLDGKYYFASKCNFGDGQQVGCESGTYTNNIMFEVDVSTNEVNVVRGVDIKMFTPIDTPYLSGLAMVFNNTNMLTIGKLCKNGKNLEENTSKFWESFVSDLGFQGKRKRVKEVILTTLYPCQLTISSDEGEKTISISGNQKEQHIRTNIYGKNFSFKFSTTEASCEIRKPMIVFDVEA